MLRLPIVAAVCALAVALATIGAIVGRGAATGTVARQAASPQAGAEEARRVASPGIERVGCGPLSFAGATGTPDPNAPPVLEFNEVRFAPGEAIAEELYRQPVVAYVASGSVDLHLTEVGSGTAVLRTLEMQNNDPQPWACLTHEDLRPGVPVTLEAGDTVYLENVKYRIRNPYSRDAVLLTAVIRGHDGEPGGCLGGCPTWP